MKKIFCLVIALMLLLSLCTVTSVAYAEEATADEPTASDPAAPAESETPADPADPAEPAEPEETPREPLQFNEDAFLNLKEINDLELSQAYTGSFKLDNSWLKDIDKVKAVFGDNINYVLKADSTKDFELEKDSDQIFVEYCTPDVEYKDTWKRAKLDATISGTNSSGKIGWWGFRYVVTDKDGSTNTGKDTEKYVLCRTSAIFIYFSDVAAPVISSLPPKMTEYMNTGVEVGSKCTISAASASDDTSSTTYYKVYKRAANGEWDSEPIFDSETKVVREGFENCISTSGVITMQPEDVGDKDHTTYKIVYIARDPMGYQSTTEGNEKLKLELFANPAKAEKTDTTQIWQIVLYVIAGLAAVGIVVVLFIKPKEVAPQPAAPSRKVVEDKKVEEPDDDLDEE